MYWGDDGDEHRYQKVAPLHPATVHRKDAERRRWWREMVEWWSGEVVRWWSGEVARWWSGVVRSR